MCREHFGHWRGSMHSRSVCTAVLQLLCSLIQIMKHPFISGATYHDFRISCTSLEWICEVPSVKQDFRPWEFFWRLGLGFGGMGGTHCCKTQCRAVLDKRLKLEQSDRVRSTMLGMPVPTIINIRHIHFHHLKLINPWCMV